MKKLNTAEKAILDAQKTANAIKEGTQKSLQSVVNEAINSYILEGEEIEDEDTYSVEDVDVVDDTTEVPEQDGEEVADDVKKSDDEDADDEDKDSKDADEDEVDIEDYKIGDNEYDITDEEGDVVVKVINGLNDDDEVVITKDEDGFYSFTDDKTGAEYVIEVDTDALADDDADDEVSLDLNDSEDDDVFEEPEDEDLEISLDDEAEDVEEPGIEVEMDDDDEDEELDITFADDDEDEGIEVEMDDDENELNEASEFNGAYQKNVFAKPINMREPGKNVRDWDKGAPKGASRPYPGKLKDPMYTIPVNEMCKGGTCDLDENGSGFNAKRKKSKHMNGIHRSVHGQQTASQGGQYYPTKSGNLDESVKKLVAKAKSIQHMNEQAAGVISELKKALNKAAVSNVSLANMVKILTECTLTNEEKKTLASRFNGAASVKESNRIFESVKRELSSAPVQTAPVLEKKIKAASSNMINETVIYKNDNPALQLMERMDNLLKK